MTPLRELLTNDLFRILQAFLLCSMLMISTYNMGRIHGMVYISNRWITEVVNPLYERFNLEPKLEIIK